MNHIPRLTVGIATASLACAALLGCSNDQDARLATSQSATTAAEPGMAGAGPMNEKELMRRQEWLDATQHLELDRDDERLGVAALSIGQRDPQAYASFMEDGDAFMEINRWVPAMGAFAEAARHVPGEADPWIRIADALQPQAKYDLMQRALNTALDVDMTRLDTHLRIADLNWTRGEQAEAIAAMQTALNSHPDAVEVHERLARWFYYTNDFDAAWQHVHATESLDGSIPAQLRNLLAQRMPEPR